MELYHLSFQIFPFGQAYESSSKLYTILPHLSNTL